MDRILAAKLGEAAVDGLLAGHDDEMVGIVADNVKFVSLEHACSKPRDLSREQYNLLRILAT